MANKLLKNVVLKIDYKVSGLFKYDK